MHQKPAEQRRSATRRPVRVAAATLVATLISGLFAPVALADDLATMRNNLRQVQQQQKNVKTDIADSIANVDTATARLIRSQNALDQARAHLADMRIQLAAARQIDANLAIQLKAEQEALEVAKAEVAKGEANLAEQVRLMGIAARDAYQQQNPLEGLSIVFDAGSTSDLSQRIQWNTTIFDTQAAMKERLDAIQVELNAARDRQARIEAEVAEQKRAAAQQVVVVRGLEAQAASQAAAVQRLVAAHETARKAAQSELDADEAAYRDLRSQEDNLQLDIQRELGRLEQERRLREEQERKQREEQQRREREEQERRNRQERERQTNRSQPRPNNPAPPVSQQPPRRSPSANDPTGYGRSSYGLIRPIAARNGSPFGLRFHPILKYWRMHNGTDFGAPTGTPLYAAADGVVLKAGRHGGFGNFVLIGHDQSIGGRYVTTGYAHQSRIAVRIGQRVRQGQLIGYVGNTGLSTTPHLHLEVRLNGVPVNPMNYIP